MVIDLGVTRVDALRDLDTSIRTERAATVGGDGVMFRDRFVRPSRSHQFDGRCNLIATSARG